jgi:hypothetical protein
MLGSTNTCSVRSRSMIGVELFNQQAFNNEHRRFRIGQTVGTVALTGGR